MFANLLTGEPTPEQLAPPSRKSRRSKSVLQQAPQVGSRSLKDLNLAGPKPPDPKKSVKKPQPKLGALTAQRIAPALALRDCNLTALNMSHQTAGDEGAVALGRALCDNASLLSLNLESNGIGDSGAVALSASLKTNGKSRLEFLSLANNRVGDDGALAIAHGVQAGYKLRFALQEKHAAAVKRAKRREWERQNQALVDARRQKKADREASRARLFGGGGGTAKSRRGGRAQDAAAADAARSADSGASAAEESADGSTDAEVDELSRLAPVPELPLRLLELHGNCIGVIGRNVLTRMLMTVETLTSLTFWGNPASIKARMRGITTPLIKPNPYAESNVWCEYCWPRVCSRTPACMLTVRTSEDDGHDDDESSHRNAKEEYDEEDEIDDLVAARTALARKLSPQDEFRMFVDNDESLRGMTVKAVREELISRGFNPTFAPMYKELRIRTHITETEDSGATMMTLRETYADGSRPRSRVEIEDRFRVGQIERLEANARPIVKIRKENALAKRVRIKTAREMFESKEGALPPLSFRRQYKAYNERRYPEGIDNGKETQEFSYDWMQSFGAERPPNIDNVRQVLTSNTLWMGGMQDGGNDEDLARVYAVNPQAARLAAESLKRAADERQAAAEAERKAEEERKRRADDSDDSYDGASLRGSGDSAPGSAPATTRASTDSQMTRREATAQAASWKAQNVMRHTLLREGAGDEYIDVLYEAGVGATGPIEKRELQAHRSRVSSRKSSRPTSRSQGMAIGSARKERPGSS